MGRVIIFFNPSDTSYFINHNSSVVLGDRTHHKKTRPVEIHVGFCYLYFITFNVTKPLIIDFLINTV